MNYFDALKIVQNYLLDQVRWEPNFHGQSKAYANSDECQIWVNTNSRGSSKAEGFRLIIDALVDLIGLAIPKNFAH